MSDRPVNGTPRDDLIVDDERLLALALGLDDDPALAAAVAERPDLALRLARAHDDIDVVVEHLHAAIPETPEDYAEPSAERWPRLHPAFEAGAAPAARRGRRGRGRLAAALAAAAILALAVGIGVADLGGSADQASVSSTTADGAAPAAPPATDKGGAESFAGESIVLPEAEHFRAVVVARAEKVVDGIQRFSVLRVLKGRVGDSIALLLHEGAQAMPVGSFEVLYLEPLGDYVMAASLPPADVDRSQDGDIDVATGSGEPAPLGAAPASDTGMPVPAAGYSMDSSDAYVQSIPAGIDYAQISVP